MFVYRCSDDHLFTISLLNRIFSVHLGLSKFGRCPVDGKWRMYSLVRSVDLTERDLYRLHGRQH